MNTAPRFKKHYTVQEAASLLPRIREWLAELEQLALETDKLAKRLNHLLGGGDAGGDSINQNIRCHARHEALLSEFEKHGLILRDEQRGWVDFPSFREGREVFLCWENGEETVEHWHELNTGYRNREWID